MKRNRSIRDTRTELSVASDHSIGRGAHYIPWLSVQDVPSRGLVSRIQGWKTGRTHHLMSRIELDFFFTLEWSESVHDIREQFPLLPVEETSAIAKTLGIRPPTDPKTQHPIVMTSDFVITVRKGIREIALVRTIKMSEHLSSARTLEKLEIERRYWANRKRDWSIVTEGQIPRTVSRNVEWLHPFFTLDGASGRSVENVLQWLYAANNPRHTLSQNAAECDDALGLQPGTSLTVFRHLLATRRWVTDIEQPIQPSQPLRFVPNSPPAGIPIAALA